MQLTVDGNSSKIECGLVTKFFDHVGW